MTRVRAPVALYTMREEYSSSRPDYYRCARHCHGSVLVYVSCVKRASMFLFLVSLEYGI